MRTRAVVTSLLLVLSAAGYAGTPSATAAPAGAAAPAALAAGGPTTTLSNGITFDHSNYQDAVRMVGEPDMYMDSKGGAYVSGPWGTPTQTSVFWKSKPAQFGIQWHSIGVVPEIKSNGQNGGGDTETTFSRDAQTVYASDLQTLICNSTQRSTDEGNSFTAGEACFPGTDRQWMGTYDPTGTPTNRRVYLAANGLAVGCYFLASTDDGLTYLPVNLDIGGSCIGKFAINETTGNLYAPTGGGVIRRSVDGGVTWTAIGDTNAEGHFFSNLDFDTAGNLYQFWTTGCASINPATPCRVFVATSPAGRTSARRGRQPRSTRARGA